MKNIIQERTKVYCQNCYEERLLKEYLASRDMIRFIN